MRIVGGTDYDHQPPAELLSTKTSRNEGLRHERRKIWQKAEASTDYWKARLTFHDAISRAQLHGTEEGRPHQDVQPDDRWPLLESYRAAIANQLLTPAPDAVAVKWKQTVLARGHHTQLSSEQIEIAIADDVAFLTARPARQSNRMNPEALVRRREFKEAMRQRIREIAARLDLSDWETKSALTLRHHKVAEFVKKHGVNFNWLLEGAGRIFRKDPEIVSARSTDDWKAIEARVRDIVDRRLAEMQDPT
jgi:hypothetical protein